MVLNIKKIVVIEVFGDSSPQTGGGRIRSESGSSIPVTKVLSFLVDILNSGKTSFGV